MTKHWYIVCQLSLANKTTNGSFSGQDKVSPAPPSYEEATAGMIRPCPFIFYHALINFTMCWYGVIVVDSIKMPDKNCIVKPMFSRHQFSLLQWCWDAHRVQLGWLQHQEGFHQEGKSFIITLITLFNITNNWPQMNIVKLKSCSFRCMPSWWSNFWSHLRLWLYLPSGEC